MKEYICEKKQTSGGWTWVEPKGELIRCKDCLFFDSFQRRHICTKHKHTVTEDGFCAWGERKNNG